MAKKRSKQENDNTRFEQISLFEIFISNDLTGEIDEDSERQQFSIVYNFETEGTVGELGGTTVRGGESPLQSSLVGNLEGTTDSNERGLVDGDISETEPNETGGRIDNGLVDDLEGDETKILQRVHLESNRLSTKAKVRYNLDAIRTLKTVQKENRQATFDEKTILSNFSGWGGCPAIFNETDDTYLQERIELKQLMSANEYQDAKASTLTSFYTPLSVIEKMYAILEHMGFDKGKILETSMGTGNFVGMMSNDMYNDSEISGVEIDGISASISALLYDKVNVQNTGFENNQFPNNYFDLAISNVPFGRFKVHDREFNSHHWNIHNYFFGKALSKVRDGGLVAFITSTDTMDGNSDIMEYIEQHADFLGAIRLPNDVFMLNGANTSVTSDIIFLRRNDEKIHTKKRKDVLEKVDGKIAVTVDGIFGYIPEEDLRSCYIRPYGYVSKDNEVVRLYKPFYYHDSRMIAQLLRTHGSMNLSDYEIPESQLNDYLSLMPEHTRRSLATEHRYVNNYFINNPQMVFGTMGERTNQYGTYELTVSGNSAELDRSFDEVMNAFPKDIYEEEVADKSLSEFMYPIDSDHSEIATLSFFVENGKLFYRDEDYYYEIRTKDELKGNDYPEDYVVFKNQTDIDKAIRLIEMSNVTLEVINLQKKEYTESEYLMKRNELNQMFDTFYKQYGALHKRGNLSLLQADNSNVYLLESLEEYNPKTREVKKADIFFERTMLPKKEIKFVDNLQDAIRLSMDTYGSLNVPYMSSIYSKNENEVESELLNNGLAYLDPSSKKIVLAEEYLSGDIYEKIEIATQNGYMENVDALNNVLPERVQAEDIVPQLGSTWIPVQYVKQFVKMLFTEGAYNKSDIIYNSIEGKYFIEKPSPYSMSAMAKDEWSVSTSENVEPHKSQPEYNGYDLLEDVLNSNIPTIRNYWDVYDEEGKKRRKSELNQERTTVARDLAEQMEESWEEWLFSDYDRKVELVDIYNRTFNNVRLRDYDGSYLSFPEMNPTMNLEPYQKNAIARIMDTNTNTLLWQQVGAGKTFEMVSAGMEMKRLGIRNKILYVVPNHLVSQWQKEFLTLYPSAKLLVASKKDMDKHHRRVFINKMATGNFDAIIMAHSSFKQLSVSNEKQTMLLRDEISDIQSAIEELDEEYGRANRKAVKQLERTKKAIETKILQLADTPRDDNIIPFDELGIDYLFVDEAHAYKNLYIYSAMRNVAGVPSQKSNQQTMDMLLKCRVLHESNGGICFATGTPVTNTMAELYNMQRYLQPNELYKMNIHCFDAWAKAFGKVTTNFEISVDGSRFVNRSRFCKFFNVAELMTHFRSVAEIQTAGMLRHALTTSTLGRKQAVPPTHIGGKPQVIAIEPSDELEDYIADIVDRTEAIHGGGVDSRVDNMLKVTSDSKKASIDMRLIDPSMPDDENGKLWTIAKKVHQIYMEYDDVNATQLIFCDSSTPNENENTNVNENGEYVFSNVYDDIRHKLCLLGIPSEQIAFIHDYNTEIAKLNLFKKMNDGEIRILFGSTQKLGAGTNVQERLVAIHHVDVPWRASDIEQQNGRGFRQGNMFNEIYEFRYVTKKSFDAYSWQMVETKSTYMAQLLEGHGDKREIEEDNQNSFSYAEVKAIASDNPIIKEKFEVDNEIRRLEGLKKQFTRKKLKAQDDMVHLPKSLETLELSRKMLSKEVAYFKGQGEKVNLSDQFTFVDDKGNRYTDCKSAWEYVKTKYDGVPIRQFKPVYVGEFMKAKVQICLGTQGEGYIIRLETPARFIKIDTCNPVARVNFDRMRRQILGLSEKLERNVIAIDKNKADYLTAKAIVESKFQYEDELRDMRARQKEINHLLEDTSTQSVYVDEITDDEEEDIDMEL